MRKRFPKRTPKPMVDRKLRSGFERKVRKHLEASGAEYSYESMVIKYEIPSSVHKYVPDWVLANGIIVESKGFWDSRSRMKMAMVIEQHPELDIRLLFQRDNSISKTSKTKYSDWCSKRGIKFAVSADGHNPEEW